MNLDKTITINKSLINLIFLKFFITNLILGSSMWSTRITFEQFCLVEIGFTIW